jgi:REP element-mobilizing transposase RayT
MRRFYLENSAYFVTTVTKERKAIFLDKKLCRILLVTVEYYKTILDYKVYGFCLMPDHLHLILLRFH